MLKTEKAEHSGDQRANLPPAGESELSTVDRVTELRTKGRDLPPIRPVSPENNAKASGEDRGSRLAQKGLRWALFALLPIAAAGGTYWYVTGGQVMSTDDAYVDADKVGISTDISGIVQDVDVLDNQHVSAGQVLYRLDPRQFQIALDNAKANLTQIGLTIDSMKVDYKRMLSDVAAQQSQADLDKRTYDRDASLVNKGGVTKQAYDQAEYTLEADKNKLEALRQQAMVQLVKLGGSVEIPKVQEPQYRQAQAQVDEAQRELDHTVIKAPFAGIVTNVPSVAPGKYLAASVTAFYLVATDQAWVEANPKETQMTYVRPGQPVAVSIDTYPGLQWQGTVESISPAGAQEFQLLPAQNTSGNWVKVVQRIPMRVRVDSGNGNLPPLRAGMSVEVDVDTGHARGLPHFLATLFHRDHGGRS
jgi:membrane fusion protein, multidrug efflux system